MESAGNCVAISLVVGRGVLFRMVLVLTLLVFIVLSDKPVGFRAHNAPCSHPVRALRCLLSISSCSFLVCCSTEKKQRVSDDYATQLAQGSNVINRVIIFACPNAYFACLLVVVLFLSEICSSFVELLIFCFLMLLLCAVHQRFHGVGHSAQLVGAQAAAQRNVRRIDEEHHCFQYVRFCLARIRAHNSVLPVEFVKRGCAQLSFPLLRKHIRYFVCSTFHSFLCFRVLGASSSFAISLFVVGSQLVLLQPWCPSW